MMLDTGSKAEKVQREGGGGAGGEEEGVGRSCYGFGLRSLEGGSRVWDLETCCLSSLTQTVRGRYCEDKTTRNPKPETFS